MTEQLELVTITDHPKHGSFDVEVPVSFSDDQVRDYMKDLDLDLLLGIPEDKNAEVGETDYSKIQEWENSSYAGLRNDRWFSHDVSASETSIAYGHKLTADELSSGIININGKDVNWKKGLARQQGNDLFIQDAEWAKQTALASLVKADLHTNPNAVASLTSVIYNVGSGNWGKSKAKKALEAGHIEDFMHETFDAEEGFVKVNGKVSRGLVRRRREEAQLFSEGYEGKSDSFMNTMSEVVAALNPISSAQASTLKSTDKMSAINSGKFKSLVTCPQIKDVNKIGIGDKINLNTQQPEESSLLSTINPIRSAQAGEAQAAIPPSQGSVPVEVASINETPFSLADKVGELAAYTFEIPALAEEGLINAFVKGPNSRILFKSILGQVTRDLNLPEFMAEIFEGGNIGFSLEKGVYVNPNTEEFFSKEEINELRKVILKKFGKNLKPGYKGSFTYSDQKGGQADFNYGGAAFITKQTDPSFRVKSTLGSANFEVNEKGHIIISDIFNSNDGVALQEANPSFSDRFTNLSNYIKGEETKGKRPGGYGILRRFAALFGSPGSKDPTKDKIGPKFKIDLGPLKEG